MAERTPTEDILARITEGDRLQALHAISEVALEHDSLSDEWVLAVTPNSQSPSFEPYTRFNVPGSQINGAVRDAWAKVARAAQHENEQTIEAVRSTLEPTIPSSPQQEPPLSSWLPTETDGEWESTQRYTTWVVEPSRIRQDKRFAYLHHSPDGYSLLLPNNEQVTTTLTKEEDAPFRIPDTKADVRPDEPPVSFTSTERLYRRLAEKLERVAKGEELHELVDKDEDKAIPTVIGLIIGLAIGLGLTAYFVATDNQDAGATMILICTGIWILKRGIMLISR